jgi:hypothetical protein
MPARVALPGSGGTGDVDGSVFSAASVDKLPGGLIGYAIATSNQSGITAAVDLTGLSVTCTPNTSRIVKVEWTIEFADASSQGTTETFRVFVVKDGSQLGFYDYVSNPGGGLNNASSSGFILDLNPTNASHTYKLQGSRSGSAVGTFTLVASSSVPNTLTVTDCGPSF